MFETSVPSLKLSKVTNNNMHRALIKLNEKQIVDISFQEYRRMCYEFLSQHLINNFDATFNQLQIKREGGLKK